MPKKVFLIADTSNEFLGRRTIPKQMVEDMLAISSVPTDSIARLAEALEREPGFPTMDGLTQLVNTFISEQTQVSAIRTALVNLWQSRVAPLLQELEQWRTANAKNTERLPDQTFNALKERLTQLIRDYPALKRFRKSRRLITITGNQIQEIDVLCDIRPVFDEDRNVIEGMIPLTTLKLVYEGQDGDTKSLEVLLTPEMLDELLNKVHNAKKKLATTQNTVAEWLPNGWVETSTNQSGQD